MSRKQTPKRRRVIFTVDAPGAESVYLSGDFNAWDGLKHPMQKDLQGVWRKTLMLFPGRYEYRFLVDGKWANDAQNPETCPNCYGSVNNIIIVSVRNP